MILASCVPCLFFFPCFFFEKNQFRISLLHRTTFTRSNSFVIELFNGVSPSNEVE